MTDMAATLCQAWRDKADDLMRISKAYKCRSTEAVKTAYIKQAAQLRMCANDLENANAREAQAAETEAASHQPVQGEVSITDKPLGEEFACTEEAHWQGSSG